MKQYNIYKTTNLINGKFYWGVHDSIDEKDGYLGSGWKLRKAIKKYGEENFRRVTKLLYDTAEEAFKDEAFIVNKETIKRKDCYNIMCGGKGGDTFSNNSKKEEIRRKQSAAKKGSNNSFYGKRHSEESKQKIRISKIGKESWMKGRKHSLETRRKMCENHANVSGENNPNYGKPRSKETKQKLHDSLKKAYLEGRMLGMKGKRHSEESKKKNSESHKGKKMSEEAKHKMRIAQTGQNNPNSKTNRERRRLAACKKNM